MRLPPGLGAGRYSPQSINGTGSPQPAVAKIGPKDDALKLWRTSISPQPPGDSGASDLATKKPAGRTPSAKRPRCRDTRSSPGPGAGGHSAKHQRHQSSSGRDGLRGRTERARLGVSGVTHMQPTATPAPGNVA